MISPMPGFIPPPVYRHLRGYAIDPSLAQQLETAPVSEVVFRLPWEPLAPGPVDEYLEVIDCDPAGRCFYEPVDLDHPHLLAQDGLPPSEGTPQFHQQMAYAVARATIHNFERALGRRAMWSPGPSREPANPHDDSHFVQRLRIYPHALREPNAYYSPAKKALLFGYYPASADDPGSHVPGSMVFTCLSHDIVAHETAHALLDGMHRRLNRATNPDMLAFHEAFGDIVALFQHFTFREILRQQIARTRGDIRSQENLLGQLAGQFGRTTGARSALRDAIGGYNPSTNCWAPRRPDPSEYETVFEPHRRGAILVAAIFDAFLSIYNSRISDLLRLSTGGSGVLPAGALHPDLVERLTDEAAKAAGHVLAMCVRALDYCPPVDMTFGEYLRAIITADHDLVPDDDRQYRVAFVEAFRRRGIYPRDVRTLSVENLIWRSPRTDSRRHSAALPAITAELRDFASLQMRGLEREDVFRQERTARQALHARLDRHFRSGADGALDALFLGLDVPAHPFEIHALHVATRVGPDRNLRCQFIVQITQQVEIPVDEGDARRGRTQFDGGCTIIANAESPGIAYCIRKPLASRTRRERQRQFLRELARASRRATYFGPRDITEIREPFAVLHRGRV
jgi:hypothetical protein